MFEVIQNIDEVILSDGLISNYVFELADPAVEEAVGLFVDFLIITVEETCWVLIFLEEIFAAFTGNRGRAFVFGAIEGLEVFLGVFALPVTGLRFFLLLLRRLQLLAFLFLALLQLQYPLTRGKVLKLILLWLWLSLRGSCASNLA